MGLICDLFVTTQEEALLYESTVSSDRGERLERFSPTELRGLTSLEFGLLWAILANEKWDASKHLLTDIAFGEGNESWLHEFPDQYRFLLSRLDSAAIEVAATAWSKCEELGSKAEDVVPVIESLVQLAKQASMENKGLYMWGCV
jgi:hypothetical protein